MHVLNAYSPPSDGVSWGCGAFRVRVLAAGGSLPVSVWVPALPHLMFGSTVLGGASAMCSCSLEFCRGFPTVMERDQLVFPPLKGLS